MKITGLFFFSSLFFLFLSFFLSLFHQFCFFHSFGVVDAGKAVEVAKTWTEIPPLLLCATEESGEWSSDRFVTSIHVSDQISVEHVCVIVTIDHPYSGDLRITLRSPRGLLSTLATPRSVINRKVCLFFFFFFPFSFFSI